MADMTGTPGSESLAGTSPDHSIYAPGGGDVTHGGGGLDTADHVDPITTATLSTLADADTNTPGDQPDRARPRPPSHQKNKGSRQPRSGVSSFDLRSCELERQLC